MGYLSYCMNLFLYIMSSCLRRYSVFNLILQMHAGQRSTSGVIVVDAESYRSTCLSVMPIYMIIPRYPHNYAQFCQLLNSNLFTHRRILMLLSEATSETYGPGVSFSSYQSPPLYYCFSFTLPFTFYFASLYQKYQKYQLSSLSDLTFVSDREGIDNP